MRRMSLRIAFAFAAGLIVLPIPAHAGDSDDRNIPADLKNLPTNLDSEIERAQALRQAGKLDQSSRSLAQLMLMAQAAAADKGDEKIARNLVYVNGMGDKNSVPAAAPTVAVAVADTKPAPAVIHSPMQTTVAALPPVSLPASTPTASSAPRVLN